MVLLYSIMNLTHSWQVAIKSIVSISRGQNCSLSSPLWYSSAVVLSDRKHPCFRNLYSTVLVDVVWVKSYVNSFFNPTRVPVRVSVN